MNHARVKFVLTCGFAVILSSRGAASDLRIWVDVNGKFSVEARVESYDDQNVLLKRKDGGDVTVPIDQLSEEDKEYLEQYRARMESDDHSLRSGPPDRPRVKSLPILDLPQAIGRLPDLTPIEWGRTGPIEIVESEPDQLLADPAPTTLAIQDSSIQIFDVDVYDNCSPPIAVTAIDEAGNQSISVAMSISRGTGSSIVKAKNQLVRFDVQEQRAYVSLNHHESIRLLDHNPDSHRSLVLTGYNSLGYGGKLAVATGWGPSGIKLSHLRPIASPSQNVRVTQPKLQWAKWIDDEHFIAVIGNSLGLWNIVSGRQLYQIDGIDHRSTPALSGGRRYLALPIKGAVVMYETESGKQLGRIPVERQIPGVSFSPASDRLAIATSRQLRCWDLTTAEVTEELNSRSILGTKTPLWVDSDLILSSSGVLLSLFRGLPVWRYEITTSEVARVGNHVVIFRKQATSELSCLTIPHPGASEAIEWLDSTAPEIDSEKWRLLGSSQWSSGAWVDENLRISASGEVRR
jgi:hypothetical protein